MIKGLENLDCEGKEKILPWKMHGGLHHSVLVLKGQLQRRWKLSFQEEKTRSNVYMLHWERFMYKRHFFCDINQSLEQCPQGCGRIPITSGFSRFSRVLGNLKTQFCMNSWTWWTSEVTTKCRLFCGSMILSLRRKHLQQCFTGWFSLYLFLVWFQSLSKALKSVQRHVCSSSRLSTK